MGCHSCPSRFLFLSGMEALSSAPSSTKVVRERLLLSLVSRSAKTLNGNGRKAIAFLPKTQRHTRVTLRFSPRRNQTLRKRSQALNSLAHVRDPAGVIDSNTGSWSNHAASTARMSRGANRVLTSLLLPRPKCMLHCGKQLGADLPSISVNGL